MTMRLLQSASRRRGQALLIVIIVLLMLALLAAALVAVVADDIDTSARDEERVTARALAWAGLRYADEMLTESIEGADWRPPLPDYVNPSVAAVPATQLEDYWDSFERLRGWDSQSVFNTAAAAGEQPVYLVKYRFAMDADATSLVTEVGQDDPSQDFSDPQRNQPIENVERTAPHDHFLLKIEYEPDPADPLSRFLRITSIGRPGGAPTAFEELVAYKQVSLLDYALYIHDARRQASVTQLGVPPLDLDGDRMTGTSNRAAGSWQVAGNNDYVPFRVRGPVRVNGGLAVQAPALFEPVQPGGGWASAVEVAGTLGTSADDNAQQGNRQVLFGQADGSWLSYADNLPGQTASEDRNQLVAPSGNPWPDALDVGSTPLYAPALETHEPLTGVSRWERLTRYSGVDIATFEGGQAVTVNSGELGYGQGIWLGNTGQRDSLEAVRNEWLRPSTWGRRRYVPEGAIIELHAHFPDPLNQNLPPAITITRTDGTMWPDPTTGLSTGRPTMVFAWPDRDGTWAGGTPGALDVNNPGTWPMPDNGVILCDGNVRVLGVMPRSTPNQDYNLTIVTRGSVYVDGPILRPSDVDPAVADDDPGNTRLALLARDHVVINPTMTAPGDVPGQPIAPVTVPPDRPTDLHWTLSAQGTEVLGLRMALCRNGENPALAPAPPNYLNLLEADGNSADGLEARSAVLVHRVRQTLGLMPAAGGIATLAQPALLGSGTPEVPGTGAPPWGGVGQPVFFADWSYLATAAIGSGPPIEYWPDIYYVDPANFNGAAGEYGVPGYITAQAGLDWTGGGLPLNRSDVIVKNMKLERLEQNDPLAPRAGLDFQVSALLFAERGTFFVIPGEWYDPLAQSQYDVLDPLNPDANARAARLARAKRFNHRIAIVGAVIVNEWPTPMEVAAWSDKWAYPADLTPDGSAGFGGWQPNPAVGATIFAEYGTLLYQYDWGFRTGSVRPNHLRLPYLPASPGLIYAGEENKR